MKTMKRTAWLCVGMALVAARAADAQAPSPATEKFFLNVNFGGQLASRTLTSTVSKSVYDEPATLTSTAPIDRGGLVTFAGGYRVWGDVYVGIDISRFSTSGDASYSATIPDPAVFNRFRTSTGTETGLSRTEVAVSPNVMWVTPLTDKLDISVGLGLAVIKLTQELAGDFTVPVGTQVAIPVLVEQKGTAKGFYASVDVIYNIKPMYGVGGFIRYAGGSADLDAVRDTKAGGAQAGAGIRLRF